MTDHDFRGSRSTRNANAANAYTWEASLLVEALTPGNPGDSTSLGYRAGTPAAFDAAFSVLVERVLPSLHEHAKKLEGANFGVSQNAALARGISNMLARLNCKLICPHCGRLSVLRYTQSGTARTPVFKYRHGNTAHGATTSVGRLDIVRIPIEARDE